MVFFDENYYDTYKFKKAVLQKKIDNGEELNDDDKKAVKSMEGIEKLMDLMAYSKTLRGQQWLTINVRYITDTDQVKQFANDAVNNGAGSINIYAGHGAGTEKDVDKDTVNYLKDKFASAPWKQGAGAQDAIDKLGAPVFAFNSCFGGDYNSTIPEANRINGSMTDKNVIVLPRAGDNGQLRLAHALVFWAFDAKSVQY